MGQGGVVWLGDAVYLCIYIYMYVYICIYTCIAGKNISGYMYIYRLCTKTHWSCTATGGEPRGSTDHFPGYLELNDSIFCGWKIDQGGSIILVKDPDFFTKPGNTRFLVKRSTPSHFFWTRKRPVSVGKFGPGWVKALPPENWKKLQVEEIMKEIDVDGSGEIEFDELLGKVKMDWASHESLLKPHGSFLREFLEGCSCFRRLGLFVSW